MLKQALQQWPAVVFAAVSSAFVTALLSSSYHRALIHWPSVVRWETQQMPIEISPRTKAEGPYQLQDLVSLKEALPTNKILSFIVPTDDFWVASLKSTMGFDTIISAYTAYNDSRKALLYVPVEGEYELTIRIPRPTVQDQGRREREPPHCYVIWFLGHSVRIVFAGGSPVYEGMRKFCGLRGAEIPGDAEAKIRGNSYPAMPLPRYTDSVYFTTRLRFASSRHAETFENTEDLTSLVFGSSSNMFRSNGRDTLGYWAKDGIVGKTPGTATYQPQKDGCSLLWAPFWGTLTMDKCEGIKEPVYRWNALSTKREDWLLKPEVVQRCIQKKTIRIYGDSLSRALFRSLVCFFDGYAGLTLNVDYTLELHEIQTEYAPFYAPREAHLEISYDDSAKLLGIEDVHNKADIELWIVSMWPISYTPSSEFARGHDRMLRHIKHHTERRSTRAYIYTATAIQSDPSHPTEVQWQTADRSFLWNAQLREAAEYHKLPLIDAFWPTAHRFDARVDNCHYCDYLTYDLAAITMKEIC